MKTHHVRVHLHDEAPRIGAGVRLVDVQIGHVYVHLRNPSTGAVAKLSRRKPMHRAAIKHIEELI